MQRACARGARPSRHANRPRRAAQLLELPNVTDIFPSDAVAKAKKYLDAIHTTGAYSESNGATVFREEIAAALQVCGTAANPECTHISHLVPPTDPQHSRCAGPEMQHTSCWAATLFLRPQRCALAS